MKKINIVIEFSIVDLLYEISLPTCYYHFERKYINVSL